MVCAPYQLPTPTTVCDRNCGQQLVEDNQRCFAVFLASLAMWPNVALILFLVLISAAALKRSKHRKAAPLPPGPWRLPIIGNLHNLYGRKMPHHLLADLSLEYGGLMHLQLGQVSMVVVSSEDAARAILKTHDQIFSNRPQILVARELANNHRDVAFAPYGEYWRTMKKIFVVELLTAKRVVSFAHIREAAVTTVLQEVMNAGTAPVDLTKLLYIVGNKTVSQVTMGSDTSQQQTERVVEAMEEMLAVASGMDLAELFPSLEWIICAITGKKRKFRLLSLKINTVIDIILRKHLTKSSEAGDVNKQKDVEQDLLTILVRHYQHQDLDFPLSIKDVQALVWDLFLAGTDTTSSTMAWAMAEMIRNPEVMLKAQSEVRRVFQEKGKMDESVVNELHYLKLVVKETLRLHPPAPLLLPREAMETSEINGYRIPAKTRIAINAWALGRDPKYWVKPLQFNPQRFLEQPVDFNGTNFAFVPFGGGRRICPGVTFAIATIHITLARLLCHFDWTLPGGMAPEDLNMEETWGATIRKKVPLCLVATTRIPF